MTIFEQHISDFSPSSSLVGEKVKELLDDDSIDEFFNSSIYTRPPSVPPLVDVKRLSPSEEQQLVSRLTKQRTPPPTLPIDNFAPPRRFMSKKSIELTQGLESIEKRALKLARAHQRRIEQLVEQKENEEAQHMYGKPRINATSRRIAERSSFLERQVALEERRKILEQEARKEERMECVFHPKINPKSAAAAARRNAAGNNINVIDRLTRDAELRQSRRLELKRAKEEEEMGQLTLKSSITHSNVLYNTRSSTNPSVFDRLYPARSTSMPPPPTSPQSCRRSPESIPFSQYMRGTYEDPFNSVNLSQIPRINKPIITTPRELSANHNKHQLDLSSIFALTRGRYLGYQ